MAYLALFVAALAVSVNAYDVRRSAPASRGILETEVLPAAQFSVPFSGKAPRSQYKKSLLKAVGGQASESTGDTGVLAGSKLDQEYLIDIIIGGQKFKVSVDTGS